MSTSLPGRRIRPLAVDRWLPVCWLPACSLPPCWPDAAGRPRAPPPGNRRRRRPRPGRARNRLRPPETPVLRARVDRVVATGLAGALGDRVPAGRVGTGQRAGQRPGQARDARRARSRRSARVDGCRRQRRGRAARARAVAGVRRRPAGCSPTSPPATENVIARMTYDGSGLSDQRSDLRRHPVRAASTTAGGSRSDPTASSTSAPARPAGATRPRTTATSAARSCGSRPTGKPAPGNPFAGLPGLDATGTATCRASRCDARGPAVGERVRPEHLGRAEPHRAGRQLRLAGRRGRAGDDEFRRPGAAVAHRRGLAERHRDRRRRGLHGRAARRAAVADPAARRHGTGKPEALLAGRYGRLRTVAVAPDGSLWVLTTQHRRPRHRRGPATTGSSG